MYAIKFKDAGQWFEWLDSSTVDWMPTCCKEDRALFAERDLVFVLRDWLRAIGYTGAAVVKVS